MASILDPKPVTKAAADATYVRFRNYDGTPVVGKRVTVTLTADGTDIDNIVVEAI